MNCMASSCIGRFILARFLLVPLLTFASHHHHLRMNFMLAIFFKNLSFLSSHTHFSFCLWALLCVEETRLLQEIPVKDMKARAFPHYVFLPRVQYMQHIVKIHCRNHHLCPPMFLLVFHVHVPSYPFTPTKVWFFCYVHHDYDD